MTFMCCHPCCCICTFGDMPVTGLPRISVKILCNHLNARCLTDAIHGIIWIYGSIWIAYLLYNEVFECICYEGREFFGGLHNVRYNIISGFVL